MYSLKDIAGGLSGLHFERQEGPDKLIFWSHSDRGPNNDEIEDHELGITKRPFLKPGFQPFWVQFSFNRKTSEIKVIQTIGLTLPDGSPMTGLPNKDGDEVPIDIHGNELKRDINGIDPESLCFDGTHFWMGEEYGPSILKFNPKGQLLRRYVPEGSYPGVNSEIFKRTLPKDLLKRKVNRGFEGLTCKDGKVYAILQSPLKKEGRDVRIFEFDPRTEQVLGEFLYPVDSKKSDKIGDMAVMGDSFLVLEQNGEVGDKGIHNVYKVNLTSLDNDGRLKKILVKDLVTAGYSFAEKVEGLTVIGPNEIAVINDNDFGVNDAALKSILGIFNLD
ncbi:MAG TPA: esterase-like activity of phytase family protein [Bacteriovoracaceae bacterium]|nr:esterase-like activity of phytase family protein [Bacteriovoracaceae bacterium]